MEHKEIYKKYLKKLKIKHPKTLQEMESVFFVARKDFFDYKISTDQFSSICEELLIITHKNVDLATSNLSTAIEAGAELSWYIRQRPRDDEKQLLYFLQYIHDYKREK